MLRFEIDLTSISNYYNIKEELNKKKEKFVDKEFEANYKAISPKYGDWC